MCHTQNTWKKTEPVEKIAGGSKLKSEVADAAETLCRTVLRYEKCTRCDKSKNYLDFFFL